MTVNDGIQKNNSRRAGSPFATCLLTYLRQKLIQNVRNFVALISVSKIGYICWAIGVICLILGCLKCDSQTRNLLVSWGVSIFAIGTGFISLGVSRKASQKMLEVDKIAQDFKNKIGQLDAKVQMLIDKQDRLM